jgi:LysR family transcriptional regulator (chromosome initiation inhibitor)
VTTLPAALRSCKVLPLGAMRYVAVAEPGFAAARCPNGLTPHNFSSLPFVAFNRKDDLQAEFVANACGLKHVSLSQLYVPSSEGQVKAVRAGWGVSVLPELQVAEHLRAGSLINLMPDCSLSVALYWHCWNLESAVLDSLTRALQSAAAQVLVAASV